MGGKVRFSNRVGEKHITKQGYEIEIIDYKTSANITVKFSNGHIVKNKTYIEVISGSIVSPYHLSVFNKGFLGVGKFSEKTMWKTKPYIKWQSMLERCYSETYHRKRPTYIGTVLYEEWHNFQVFAEWHEQNWKDYMEGWHLDKDILVKDSKTYSPETCCFVPNEINTLFARNSFRRGLYPIGVSEANGRFVVAVAKNGKNKSVGYFDTPEEAFQAYKVAKESWIKEVAEEWKHLITSDVYQALLNYQVEMTD